MTIKMTEYVHAYSIPELEAIEFEVCEKYDIYDLITLLNLDLAELYDILEPYVLENIDKLELNCIRPDVVEDDDDGYLDLD